MKSVEERLFDALTELEALLNDGKPVDESVDNCANLYEFKAKVIEFRARRAFGDLATLKDRNLKRAEVLDRDHKAETAIDLYLKEDPEESFPVWFEHRVGRLPTKLESADYLKRSLDYLCRNMKFEI